MKKTILLLAAVLSFIISCETERKKIKKEDFPKFQSVKEMLSNAGNFYVEDGSLKFINSDSLNLHIQISKPVTDNDPESLKNEIVKRDIVYVAFQTFAETELNELTITSVPMELNNKGHYYEKYKKTVKVDRNRAKSVLKKYLDSEDFSILYKKTNGMWLPNEKLDKLKFEKLNQVFNDLSK